MLNTQYIAIIGSSPIQLFLALSLANNGHFITIFNSDSWLGGAWRRTDTPYGVIPTHNNIILYGNPVRMTQNYEILEHHPFL